jgi:nucleoid-associated protein YgaU
VQPPAAGTPAQTAEVAKTQPDASGPAPEQPAIENKKQEVTTAAVAAAEQTAKTTEPDKPRSGKVVIQPGNNLWKLSRVIYGRGKSYTVIYKANKDQIRNPNRIYPGQIFAIPNAKPPESIDPKRKEPLTSAEGGAAQ